MVPIPLSALMSNDTDCGSLAYAEMRLILARIIFEFDLTLADESKDWLKNATAFTTWRKIPLYVYLTAVKGE